jgi:hypothetical protein
VYSISFSFTQRLGGHIPQDLEAHNKSKTQTNQSLTRSIPSLSSAFNQHCSRRLGLLNIHSAWSRACISFTFLAHSTHLLRDLTLFRAAWHTFHLARQSIVRQLLPHRPLFSPARGLVRSPSLLPCEQHTNNTIGLALLHKPSARFPHPEARHASFIKPHPMPSFGQLLDC